MNSGSVPELSVTCGLESSLRYALFLALPAPIWWMDATSLQKLGSENFLFVDVTDAIVNDPDFENASGIMSRWEVPISAAVVFWSPERAPASGQPVWLILKSFENSVAWKAMGD